MSEIFSSCLLCDDCELLTCFFSHLDLGNLQACTNECDKNKRISYSSRYLFYACKD